VREALLWPGVITKAKHTACWAGCYNAQMISRLFFGGGRVIVPIYVPHQLTYTCLNHCICNLFILFIQK